MAETSASSGLPSTSSSPAAAPAVASSSTSQAEINAKVREAKTPADLRALTEQLRKAPISTAPVQQKAPVPEAAPAVEATPAEVPAEPAAEAEVQPEGEQPAAGTEATPEEGQDQAAAEPEGEETEDGGDGPITPVSGKRAHLRLPENDQVGRLAAALMKRNRDMPMAEAVAKASEQLGIQKAPESKQAEDPQTPKLPRTVKEVDAATHQKLADLKKAMSEVRFEDAADIQAELMQLTMHRSNIERSAEREASQAETKYHADYSASETKAVDLYPFAADPKSPGGKRMMEIERALEQNGDPLFHSPGKPLKIAQMVAAELNIAPRSKTPPVKAAAPVAPAPKKGVLPTGSSRTVPPAANQPPAIDAQIKAVKNPYELRKLMQSMGIRS